MPNWLSEFLYVLSLSKKTRWAIALGFLSFFGVHLLGYLVLSDFQLQGQFKDIQDVIIQKFARKYDKLALLTLISFLVLAYRCYQKDRKRFW